MEGPPTPKMARRGRGKRVNPVFKTLNVAPKGEGVQTQREDQTPNSAHDEGPQADIDEATTKKSKLELLLA